MTVKLKDLDNQRRAAFEQLWKLREENIRNYVTRQELNQGFQFERERIMLHHPQKGIWKPRQFDYLLSIATMDDGTNNPNHYSDQTEGRKIHRKERGCFWYHFQGSGENAQRIPVNIYMREAAENNVPFIWYYAEVNRPHKTLFYPYLCMFSNYEIPNTRVRATIQDLATLFK